MAIVFFSDIDDTLIQRKKNYRLPVTNDANVPTVSTSYSTAVQKSLINLCNEQIFIPVTGRNKAAIDRLSIAMTSFKVIDHGAIILNENDEVDPLWQQMLVKESGSWQGVLEDYSARILKFIDEKGLELRCKLISDFGFACYVSIKGRYDELLKLSAITDQFSALANNARVHINDSNMALLPPFACKKRAVEFLQQYFIAQAKDTLFVGMGDSNSDLAFMQTCHFQMIPQHSQINTENLYEHY
jgi:hydroxymethylpyrimidine pyrophosphatase-like HAD family hydrolase